MIWVRANQQAQYVANADFRRSHCAARLILNYTAKRQFILNCVTRVGYSVRYIDIEGVKSSIVGDTRSCLDDD